MIVKAPLPVEGYDEQIFRVFIAGSVEKNKPVSWQEKIQLEFGDSTDIMILNPVRNDWDSTWVERADNPKFKEQVTWELDAMSGADLIIMYFVPEAQSPVTLLEFGLQAASGKLIVCCPEGFWRKGNVDIVCQRYGVQQVDTVEELMDIIHLKSKSKIQ